MLPGRPQIRAKFKEPPPPQSRHAPQPKKYLSPPHCCAVRMGKVTNREEKTEAAREVPLLFLAHTSFHLSTPYVSNEEEEEGISNTAHPYFPYPSSWGEEE